MTKRRGIAVATVMIVAVLIGVNVLPSAAQQAPQPIATELLTGRAVFPDDVNLKIKVKHHRGRATVVRAKDPSRTLVARFTVQPGAKFPWHSHAGPVIVNVTQGELVYVSAEDCSRHAYPAGTAFVDPGHGHAHSAINPTGEETVLVATFFEAPEQGSLLIPAPAPEGCDI